MFPFRKLDEKNQNKFEIQIALLLTNWGRSSILDRWLRIEYEYASVSLFIPYAKRRELILRMRTLGNQNYAGKVNAISKVVLYNLLFL